MSNFSKVLPISVFLFLFTAVLVANAQQDRDKDRRNSFPRYMDQDKYEDPNDKMESVFKDLDLTEEQRRLLREHRGVARDQMKTMEEALREKRRALTKAIVDEDSDTRTISPIVAEVKKLTAQMVDARVNHIITVKSILTPEQFKKFTEEAEKAEKKKKHHSKEMGL